MAIITQNIGSSSYILPVFFGNTFYGKIKSCNLNPGVSQFIPEINIG
jgi:hypothetical protein